MLVFPLLHDKSECKYIAVHNISHRLPKSTIEKTQVYKMIGLQKRHYSHNPTNNPSSNSNRSSCNTSEHW